MAKYRISTSLTISVVRIFGEVSGLSWSRLSGNDEGSFVRDRLSPEQVAWLRDHGHDVRSWGDEPAEVAP